MALEQLRSKFSRNNSIILYKLLNDLLFIEVVFFLLALIGEGLLTGAVTAHVSFLRILVAVGITVLAILYTAKKADINLKESRISKKTAYLLSFVLILLLFVSLIKINIILNIIISLAAISTGYFIYKIIILDSKKD